MSFAAARASWKLSCACWAALAVSACCAAGDMQPTGNVASVRPMIGTSEHGHTFPGATVPFGMVQLSPDTRLDTWDGSSGYHGSDSTILGFSHTHLSGTGCADLGDLRVIPLCGPTDPPQTKEGYPHRFSHADETTWPGYYSVLLQDPKIKAELTATAHAGFHRYTFPAGQAPRLILDLDRGIGNSNYPLEGGFTVEKDTVISGYRRSKGWAKDKTYYFVMEFSRPFAAFSAETNEKAEVKVKAKAKIKEGKKAKVKKTEMASPWQKTDSHKVKGMRVIGRVEFQDAAEPLMLKVGVSAVSIEEARKNLAAEIPGWDFEATVAAAEQSWADLLGRIDIETHDPAVRETFYSALYHVGMSPTLFNNVDRSYCGLDHQVHTDAKFQNYCTFSCWDTFRAEHPLLTIVQPQRVNDFVNSFLAHYHQSPEHSLPIWPLAGNETWCMIGYHSVPIIVDAYIKGFRDFDVEAVYAAIRDTATHEIQMDNKKSNFLDEYEKLGYVPSADRNQSVSRTMEYAYDDWCIAQMAQLLGKTDDVALFSKRAQNYRNVFDPSIGFVRGKTAEGKWHEPFNPRELVWEDFTEATSWNYTWFVPHDVPSLIQLIGGDEAFVTKLDKMFSEDSTLLSAIPDLTGLIGQYIHGNEPCHHVAYLYNYAGMPWKTQQRIRQVMTTLYDNTPGGLCGNDDCGQMSAWYVLSAMGFYPVNPVSSVYVIGSPMVDRATIHLDPQYHSGKTFTIIAENNSPKNVYVQSATLNGKPLTRSWFTHAELVAGGELVLKMGSQPNPAWGQQPEDRPPAVAPAL